MLTDDVKTIRQLYEEMREQELEKFCDNNFLKYVAKNEDGREQIETAYARYLEALKKKKEEIDEKQRQEIKQRQEMEKELEYTKRVTAFQNSIPTIYKNADISDFTSLKDMIEQIIDGRKAIILGDNDTGKTRLAWALGKKWIEKDESVQVWDAQVLISIIKAQDSPYGYMDGYLNSQVKHLIIDEIDKIFNSTADFVYFNYLIKIRYEWNNQTILIGNGNKDEFIRNGLGQTVFSKMIRDGGLYLPLKRR